MNRRLERVSGMVIKEFRLELDRSKLPGYRSTYDDYDHEDAVAAVPAGKEATAVREKTHVQPAEQQPRSPHRAPAHQPANRHAPRPTTDRPVQGNGRGGFGEGIF